MKAKQKKQLISLTVLLVVLAGFIVGYLVLSKMDFGGTGESTDTGSTAIAVTSGDATKLTAVTYSADGGEGLTFIRQGEVWFYEADLDFPVKQSLLSNMATAVSAVTADRELINGDSGEYGFDEPSLTVSATYSDGTEYTLTVGDENSFNSMSYLKDQSGKVYMFSDTLTTAFSYALRDLIELDDPTVDILAEEIDDFTVTSAEGAKNVITDADGIETASAVMEKLDCTDWVSYGLEEADFADYGITDSSAKLTVNYEMETVVTDASGSEASQMIPKTLDFIFGEQLPGKDENGETVYHVYYTVSGSSIVYYTELSVYEEAMALLDYEAPETTETETAEDTSEVTE